jgi:hypothetical protein
VVERRQGSSGGQSNTAHLLTVQLPLCAIGSGPPSHLVRCAQIVPPSLHLRLTSCSPNACPDVLKALQPIPRVRASLLQAYRCGNHAAYRCGNQAASRDVSVSVCEACDLPYGRSVSSLRARGGGWWVHPFILPATAYIHPSRLPAECILPSIQVRARKARSRIITK